MSFVTYIAATIVISSLAPVALKWIRTFLTQLAATFVSLVAPAAVGNIGTNSRYLQQAGASPAVAIASVGATQLFVFASYIILVIVLRCHHRPAAGAEPHPEHHGPARRCWDDRRRCAASGDPGNAARHQLSGHATACPPHGRGCSSRHASHGGSRWESAAPCC